MVRGRSIGLVAIWLVSPSRGAPPRSDIRPGLYFMLVGQNRALMLGGLQDTSKNKTESDGLVEQKPSHHILNLVRLAF